jgi:hypothetical protein
MSSQALVAALIVQATLFATGCGCTKATRPEAGATSSDAAPSVDVSGRDRLSRDRDGADEGLGVGPDGALALGDAELSAHDLGGPRDGPSGPAAPLPEEPVTSPCGRTPGRIFAVTPQGTCVFRLAFTTQVFHSSSAYGGKLPSCAPLATTSPGFSFRATVETVTERVDQPPLHTVSLDVVDRGPDQQACGRRVEVTSDVFRPLIKPGDALRFSERLTQLTDSDVTGTSIIARDNGDIVYARVVGGHAERYDQDLLRGLSLALEGKPVCQIAGESTSLRRVDLTTPGTGAAACAVDAEARSCCTLWGRSFAVRVDDASTDPARTPTSRVTFELFDLTFFALIKQGS